MTTAAALYDKAGRHLARRDPILKRLITQVGPCTLQPQTDHFGLLVRSIVSQQISGRAAESISRKLVALLAPRRLNPRSILQHTEETLRSAGLSAAKARYLLDLALKVSTGEVALKGTAEQNDEAVIETLTLVKGIGRWTAQMFLIFSLGRLDVLPVDDLGLRAGVRREYELEALPDRKTLAELGEQWRPYRSIATWYMWRSRGPVPES